ncbi:MULTISPECIES: alpha/beta fold hydrolase [unclassified Corallococcus]|uniref:alpha/beta fold hydrolase n=1 Tax=unclassified Corallococcus TaxID=2685029 RepID=UPI001A905A64|nr:MULTISPECIES: alpha/beta hydrolase [unclassified Corallococcus]MBN9682607.1 alpha/beta hydrolase [Corallococcus sp. NCSPR001]WAS85847.1 alpha/beta hydrolase [Corallococcus sp. NCRR]
MNAQRFTPRNMRRLGLLHALWMLLAVSAIPSQAVASEDVANTGCRRKPTIVLVHGAFADASGWADVIKRLQRQGYTAHAFANPLRSISGDAEYLRYFLGTLTGPVVLVGHSYGGAIITNAANGNPSVRALVYIAAYALDEGESISEANTLGGGHSELGEHLVLRPFPGGGSSDADAYIDPAFFQELFAADLREKDAAVGAASQRPAAVSVFNEPSGPPAWKVIPSWYMVARDDNTIPPEAERFMARRARAHTVEIRSSHVAMISHPEAVTELIFKAAGCR